MTFHFLFNHMQIKLHDSHWKHYQEPLFPYITKSYKIVKNKLLWSIVWLWRVFFIHSCSWINNKAIMTPIRIIKIKLFTHVCFLMRKDNLLDLLWQSFYQSFQHCINILTLFLKNWMVRLKRRLLHLSFLIS